MLGVFGGRGYLLSASGQKREALATMSGAATLVAKPDTRRLKGSSSTIERTARRAVSSMVELEASKLRVSGNTLKRPRPSGDLSRFQPKMPEMRQNHDTV